MPLIYPFLYTNTRKIFTYYAVGIPLHPYLVGSLIPPTPLVNRTGRDFYAPEPLVNFIDYAARMPLAPFPPTERYGPRFKMVFKPPADQKEIQFCGMCSRGCMGYSQGYSYRLAGSTFTK
jgi:hypothetical protein